MEPRHGAGLTEIDPAMHSSSDRKGDLGNAGAVRDLPNFPGEHPKAHEAVEFMEAAYEKVEQRQLQPVLTGELPMRVRHLRNYPEHLINIDPTVAASLSPEALRKEQREAARLKKENESNDELIRTATLEDSTAV